jgi:hypothetical protein
MNSSVISFALLQLITIVRPVRMARVRLLSLLPNTDESVKHLIHCRWRFTRRLLSERSQSEKAMDYTIPTTEHSGKGDTVGH